MLKSGTIDCAIQKYISAQKKNDYEGMVEAAEQWATEHPIKTRQSEFLKLFPYARVKKANGLPIVSPCDLDVKLADKCKGIPCQECWKKFWLAEVEE
jgi:hypothetical protein